MPKGGVGNAVVDNFCAGGICYPIDENTGIIYGSGNDRTFTTEYLIHPGTDIIMIGKVIPYWDKIIEMIKRAALVIPEVRLVGWDVAITSNGVQIIEGNHNPGIQMLEYVGRGQHLKQILSYCFYRL